jgi:hypothetical protein
MRWVRFSVAGLMGVVLLLALGMAALRANSDFWASTLFTGVVLLLSVSVIAAMATRGTARSTWTGMAVFGWVYLVIAFGPWTKEAIGPPPLVTSILLDYLQDYVVSETPYLVPAQQLTTSNTVYTLRGKQRVPGPKGISPLIVVIPYLHTGHSLGALLFGIMGAGFGRFIAARGGQAETVPR